MGIRHIVLRWLMWQLLMNYSRLARTEAWRTTLTGWSEWKQMKTKKYSIRFRQAQVALMEIQARTSVLHCLFVCDEQMWWKLWDGIMKSETKLRNRTTCHKREEYQNLSLFWSPARRLRFQTLKAFLLLQTLIRILRVAGPPFFNQHLFARRIFRSSGGLFAVNFLAFFLSCNSREIA